MNQRFRPDPEASAELEDAALWYEQKRAGLGVEFVHRSMRRLIRSLVGQRSDIVF